MVCIDIICIRKTLVAHVCETSVLDGTGLDKNAIQRIVTGIELIAIAKAFDVTIEELVQNEE